jgi:hypothetical protein
MFLFVRSRRVPSLGLDNGGKPGEAAVALAVRHHLICHQIDVIDRDERDAVSAWPSGRRGSHEQAGGETAKDADGGEGAFRCDPAGLPA